MSSREDAWELLSELFVDTERSEDDLVLLARRLKGVGYSLEDLDYFLKKEVAPIAGRWMQYPGAIGAWPGFDRDDLEIRIRENLQRPWYRRQRVWLARSVRREWSIVQAAMRNLTT